MAQRLIGIDAGGTMTKAALFELDGTEVACARRSNVMLFPATGHTERDPERMWEAACSAIAAVLEESGTRPEDVAAIAATGYGAGLYLVDKDFSPVRPGIVSTDSRGAALVAGYEASGLARWGGERLKQRFWPGQASILLDWLTRNEPGIADRTYSALLCKDYLRAKLCGDCSTDATDAGISGLIDVSTGTYAEDLLRELGLGDWLGRLPPIGPPTEIVGRVSAGAARQTGLLAGTPVVRAVVDVASASLASGMHDPSIMTIVAGTFSINQTLHLSPRTSRLPFLQCAYPAHGYYLATEGAATSAGNLEWFCRVMLDAEAARAATQGKSIYDICERLLCDSLGRSSDLLFFPFLFGGPGGAPAGIVGLTAAHSLADVVRAVYEGVVFAHRMDVDALLAGPDAAKPTQIRLAGGGARSETWPQLFADVLGLPIDVMQCGELGAQGAAMCAAVAIGAQPNLESAMQIMPRTLRSYSPDPETAETYRRKYERFTRVAAALAQLAAEQPEPYRLAS